MKCIQAIRANKDVQVGDIKRVDDKTAINMVGSSWKYVSKTEWKKTTRRPKENQVVTNSETSQQQLEKKAYKKGERSEKHKNKQ